MPDSAQSGAEQYEFIAGWQLARHDESRQSYPQWMIVAVMVISFVRWWQESGFVALILGGALFLMLFGTFSLPRGKRITVSAEGIRLRYFGTDCPEFLPWEMVVSVKQVALDKETTGLLLSLLQGGTPLLLEIRHDGKECYRSVEHASPLDTVIARFYDGTIKEADDKDPVCLSCVAEWNLPCKRIERAARPISYIGLGLTLAAVVVSLLPEMALLENSRVGYWYVLIAGGCVLAMLVHLRHDITHKPVWTLCAALFMAVCSAFLVFAVTHTLPRLLGTPQAVVFEMIEDTPQRQCWQAVAQPQFILVVDAAQEARKYRQPGTRQEFETFSGPWGLHGIHYDDWRNLWY